MPVKAIRGAITVDKNEAREIIDSTRLLLESITEKNNLTGTDIISIFFSVTDDLDTAFPAVAAREIGWTEAALMCTNEINVPGSLKKCIRVLMHINCDKSGIPVKHVYLRGAKILRPDL
jgi:chorismate mutase